MEIQQFRYASDNLGYLIFGDQTALAVDGGAVSDILTFLKDRGLRLLYATNTHSHADHTAGTQDLLKHTDATFLDIPTVRQKERIEIEAGYKVQGIRYKAVASRWRLEVRARPHSSKLVAHSLKWKEIAVIALALAT